MAPPIEDVFYFTQDPDVDPSNLQPPTGWYFWDVDGLQTDGPFTTEQEAEEARQAYLLTVRQENE